MGLWLKNGLLVKNDAGALVSCNDCPCDGDSVSVETCCYGSGDGTLPRTLYFTFKWTAGVGATTPIGCGSQSLAAEHVTDLGGFFGSPTVPLRLEVSGTDLLPVDINIEGIGGWPIVYDCCEGRHAALVLLCIETYEIAEAMGIAPDYPNMYNWGFPAWVLLSFLVDSGGSPISDLPGPPGFEYYADYAFNRGLSITGGITTYEIGFCDRPFYRDLSGLNFTGRGPWTDGCCLLPPEEAGIDQTGCRLSLTVTE